MLTRLSDRIEKDPGGEEVKIRRWGMWGTNLEIEARVKKYFVVYPSGKQESFRTLAEAENFLKEQV